MSTLKPGTSQRLEWSNMFWIPNLKQHGSDVQNMAAQDQRDPKRSHVFDVPPAPTSLKKKHGQNIWKNMSKTAKRCKNLEVPELNK